MKIVFNVPDGEYCLDCPHQEKFGVEEIETTTVGDSFHRYTRVIIENCHLFNEKITGTSLEKMGKCLSCEVNGKEDKKDCVESRWQGSSLYIGKRILKIIRKSYSSAFERQS